MNPHYVIDGYNFIHKIPKFKEAVEQSLEQARNLLISVMKTYLATKHIQITLVFDGDFVGFANKIDQSTERLKIIFSSSPEKADPLIKRLIRKEKNKKALMLISADNDLIHYCKMLGANVLSPELFFYQLSKATEPDQMEQKYNNEISEHELNEWMNIFGVKE